MNGIHEAEMPQMLRRVMKDMGYESSQEFIKDTTEDLWEDDEDEVPFDDLPPAHWTAHFATTQQIVLRGVMIALQGLSD